MMSDRDTLSTWLPLLEQSPWVVRTLVCSTLVIVLTWLVVIAARRKSAAIRHRIFCLGFISLLVVPAVVAFTDGWNPMIALAGTSATAVANRTHDNVNLDTDPKSSAETPFQDDDRARATSTIQHAEADSHAMRIEPANQGPQDWVVNDQPYAVTAVSPVMPAGSSQPASRIEFSRPHVMFSMIWIAGALFLALKLATEWLLTRSLVRNGVPVTDESTTSLLAETRRFAARRVGRESMRAPRLLCSGSTPVPIAVGIFAPTIVLPAGFGKWSTERLRIVLTHELTHLDRQDVLTNLLARLACLVYWFNPLVWLAARRLNLERELACDDYVLFTGESPECYANDLVEIAASLKPRFQTVRLATPMATQSNLKIRVEHLMNAELDRGLISGRTALLTTVVASMTLVLLAISSPSFGIAQDAAKKTNNNRNDVAVTLSGPIAEDWFEKLKGMPNLQKLTLRNPDLQHLKVAKLRELENLTEFSAEDFSIGTNLADIVAVNVAQLPRLKSLQFHRTGLTGRGVEALSQSTTSELVLDGEELLAEADFKHLAAMPALSNLILESTPIETDGLTALQGARNLRRLAVLRHPSGSYRNSSAARVKAIARFEHLDALELSDTGYEDLVPLKACKSLRNLTLHSCGGSNAAASLKQLTRLKRIDFDDTDVWKESLEDLKSTLAQTGITYRDVTRNSSALLARHSAPPDEVTLLARRALEPFDIGRQFPSFWLTWHHHWSKIPTLVAEPIRTIHRLKQALTADHEIQPWQQDTTYAHAPGQFFVRLVSMENNVPGWQQTTYGDADMAWSREGPGDKPPLHILRSGVKEFEESMGHHFPSQLSLIPQHMWWGTMTRFNNGTSPISPDAVVYVELPEDSFAGEACRVLESAGRNERLWVSKATGRLRGVLHYVHQGYFTPFHKQEIVTKLIGRRVESLDDYRQLTNGPRAVSPEIRQQLTLAWSLHEFSNAYPGGLTMLDDYREVAPGKWFPLKVISANWHHNKENEGKYDFNVSESVVTEVSADRNDLESYWAEFQPKDGDKVQDQRYAVAVEYPFDKNRADEETQKLVNNRLLEQARSQILIDAAQSPFAKMVGKPAPVLPVKGWIGERPELAGKRYLIHFWATWCGPCKNDVPLLNSIAKNRIVIGVHPGDTSIEKIGQARDDAKMTYPTVVVPPDAKDLLGYPAKMFPYCVEVDEQGRVAKHGFLHDVLEINARDLAPAEPTSKKEGSILAIGDDGLAVISLGETDGLEAKQLLDVIKDGKRVTQLRLVTLSKNRGVGKIANLKDQALLKVGDKVQ